MLTVLMPNAGRIRRALAATALMMFIGLASAGAARAQGLVVSTGVIPLSGFVGDIHIEGWLHVVTQIPPSPIVPATLHANLPAMDVVATDSLGTSYLAHGAGLASLVCLPGDPCQPVISGFMLHRMPAKDGIPPNPIAPIAFSLSLNLTINADGTLNADLSSAGLPE